MGGVPHPRPVNGSRVILGLTGACYVLVCHRNPRATGLTDQKIATILSTGGGTWYSIIMKTYLITYFDGPLNTGLVSLKTLTSTVHASSVRTARGAHVLDQPFGLSYHEINRRIVSITEV